MQVDDQTVPLKAYWDLPVFNLVQNTGEVLLYRTSPEIYNECLGVSLLDAPACGIRGWVFCLPMRDAKALGPFLLKDTDTSRCLGMAFELCETMIVLRDSPLNLSTVQMV